ncbi:MAG: class I SAM-dependent methyltransferase [Lachnospiraceae bacterium]|nr:class I SAM-dependent methyltransferase [Lachnospiraceae bacterium]
MKYEGTDQAYDALAYVYDELMDNIPYTEWCEVIVSMIEKYGVSEKVDRSEGSGFFGNLKYDDVEIVKEKELTEDEILNSEKNLVVDLGCGTGTLTNLMYKRGYDMIGIDCSESMLEVAQDKRDGKGYEILYINQDMRDLDLYSTVGTIYSVCDSINYLLKDDEVIRTFKLIENFLYPGGLFMFDFNTLYKYEQVIGDSTIAENREDCAFIWENFYDDETHINEYDLSIFIERNEPDIFKRYVETHYQRGYTLEEMLDFLKKAELKPLLIRDSDTRDEPTAESQRIFIVTRKEKREDK